MEVSVLRGRDAALLCDHCGYPRRGLPETSLCPECGTAPGKVQARTPGLPTITIDQQGQIRLVALGLWLLLIASFYSMQLAVVMHYENLSLHAINLPSPKIAAVTLVQREIGGRPGPWGTMGWTCVLFQLVSVYLITVPRLRNGAAEAILSLRRVTRWTTLVCVAALMGFMLSHGQGYIPLLSWYTWDLLLYALVFGEIPANVLLYLYLARLADRFRQPRAARTIRWLAWIGLAVRLACVGVLIYPFKTDDLRDDVEAITLMALACFAIPAGVVGWAAVLGVTLRACRLGLARPARRAAALVRDRAPVLRQLLRGAERHGARVCVVAGLALWLLAISGQFSSAVGAYPGREGLGGELPLLNYAGPKISAGWIAPFDSYWYYAPRNAITIGSIVMIVFLLTTRLPGQTRTDDRWRFAVRWGTIGLIGIRGGLMLTLPAQELRESYLRVGHLIAIEAPATAGMLLYLARVARLELLPALRRRLTQWAIVSPVLILAPVTLHVLSAQSRGYWYGHEIALVGAVYCTVSVIAGVIAIRVLAQLAWHVARPIWAPSPAPADADHPAIARAAAL